MDQENKDSKHGSSTNTTSSGHIKPKYKVNDVISFTWTMANGKTYRIISPIVAIFETANGIMYKVHSLENSGYICIYQDDSELDIKLMLSWK